MRWVRRRHGRYIDWDAWEPKPFPSEDAWTEYRRGGPTPDVPMWVFNDRRNRPGMEPEEYAAMPWWERLRWGHTWWDPRDRSKFERIWG
ncbi:hypothetical protein Q5424_20730 [Conexibacter sp. JD483]|uniref:hypothetical protein n=1 Tax=unclassified Conexibacter TaxID=2627773 RepID=UPI002721CC3B|nr:MULTISPECIES: hypothetical protein [unclassified Conexibacter]MDO8185557.1 hypothetical protein [Conexibacter sp. CPCC 205706]MDO8197256.1 hypothetical protein [Conexibacter sp. CPCC 205762]MDR9371537.1 hypothetical protein [Conexibacter sp. JD483]